MNNMLKTYSSSTHALVYGCRCAPAKVVARVDTVDGVATVRCPCHGTMTYTIDPEHPANVGVDWERVLSMPGIDIDSLMTRWRNITARDIAAIRVRFRVPPAMSTRPIIPRRRPTRTRN